ncbi:hypothetical protein MKW92_040344 [Papaver armeniacum]|nr:hypothetical protein MKW92_040344 [Papaver armeniacum]
MLYTRNMFDEIPLRDRDVFIWNTLIRGYSDKGTCRESIVVYKKMHENEFSPDHYTFPFKYRSALGFEEIVEKDVVTWTSLIAGDVHNGWFMEGLDGFRRMVASGIHPNMVTLVSVLPACAVLNLMSLGELIHGCGIKFGVHSDVSFVDALISMYGKCKFDSNDENVKTARGLFDRMVVRDTVRHLVTRKRLENNLSTTNALIDTYAKCGSIDLAREVFERLPERTVVSWTATIYACAVNEHGYDALEMFSRMLQEKVKPNGFTFIAVLTAGKHSGLIAEGRKYFDSMEKDYSIVHVW